MKLHHQILPRSRTEKSQTFLAKREQEPNSLFEYTRDIPLSLRKSMEAYWVEQPSIDILYLCQLLDRPDLIQKMHENAQARGHSLKEMILLDREFWLEMEPPDETGPTEKIEILVGQSEDWFDIVGFFDRINPDNLDHLRKPLYYALTPQGILMSGDPIEGKISKLFAGYKIFPEWRVAYQEMVEKYFDIYIGFLEDNMNANWTVVVNLIKKLWFLSPNKRPELEQFVKKHKQFILDRVKERPNDPSTPIFAIDPIFIFTIIARFDASITLEGKLQFKQINSPPSQIVPLPGRLNI